MKNIYYSLLAIMVAFGTQAQTLFLEDFNAGIGAWTVTDFLNDGLTWEGTTGGYNGGGTNFLDGTEFALVDSDADGNGIEMIETLTSPVFDATLGSGVVLLEFDQYYRDLNGGDSAWVDVFDGAQWQNVALFTGASFGAWNTPDFQSINVSAFANANMQVRFHYNDNNTWAWWWAIDNVHFYSPVPDDAGAIAINTIGGLNLTATEVIDIDVEVFGSNALSNIPVFYRINGGAPVGPELVAGPVAAGGTANYAFTATADLSVPGTYFIEAWTEYPADGDMTNDTVSISLLSAINPAITLPFCADFEDADSVVIANGQTNYVVGALPYLIFESGSGTGQFGRLRTSAGPAFAQSGTKALTLDTDLSGATLINYATLQLDMAAYDATTDTIFLDYSFMEHGDEVNPNDMVWIRGNNTDAFILIGDWNTISGGTNGVYYTESDIDISAALNGNSQNFSSTFEIRFGQEDNFPATSTTASDGLTIDDVCLRQVFANDAATTSIISPANDDCGDEFMEVCAIISNTGLDTIFSMPVELNWTDGVNSGTLSTTYADTLVSGASDTVCFSPINSLNGGAFAFEVLSQLVGDAFASNDTTTSSVNIVNVVVDIDTAYCLNVGDSMMLIPNTLGGSFMWYDSLVGGTLLATVPDTFWTGAVSNDMSFFVESSNMGCVSERVEVQVNINPTVAMTALDSACVYDAAVSLANGTPAGGTYSGPGVSAGQFDPATAGIGTHTIVYDYTAANGCAGSDSTSVVVDGCASIDELNALAVSLFPNPTTGVVNIETEGDFAFTIVDMQGAIVAQGAAVNTHTAETASFEAGVYFVKVTTTKGTATVKLVVQ